MQGRTRADPCGAHTPLTPVLVSSEGVTVGGPGVVLSEHEAVSISVPTPPLSEHPGLDQGVGGGPQILSNSTSCATGPRPGSFEPGPGLDDMGTRRGNERPCPRATHPPVLEGPAQIRPTSDSEDGVGSGAGATQQLGGSGAHVRAPARGTSVHAIRGPTLALRLLELLLLVTLPALAIAPPPPLPSRKLGAPTVTVGATESVGGGRWTRSG